MRTIIVALTLGLILTGAKTYAETVDVVDRHLFHKHINSVTVHDKAKELRSPVNVGAKVDLLKFDKVDVTQEITRDTANGVNNYTTLVEVKLETGLLQTFWKKAKALIGR